MRAPLSAAVALVVATAAAAQTAPDNAEVEALRADARARELTREADSADTRARQARRDKIAVAARIQASERRSLVIAGRIRALEVRYRSQRSRLAREQGETARLLAALETLSRRPGGLVLLQPTDAITTARVSALLAAVQPRLEARTSNLRAEVAATRRLRAQLDDARSKLAAAQAALAADARRLETLQAEHRQRRDRLDAEADAERLRVRAMASRAIDLRGLARAIERVPTRADVLPPAGKGAAYRAPATGRIRLRYNEANAVGVRSRGITLDVPDNAQVIAPAAGRVAYAGPFRDYGDIVIIEHGEHLLSMIAGLKRVDVEVGEEVGAGSPLGKMGAVDPELYLEIRAGGRPVDPLTYLASAGRAPG